MQGRRSIACADFQRKTAATYAGRPEAARSGGLCDEALPCERDEIVDLLYHAQNYPSRSRRAAPPQLGLGVAELLDDLLGLDRCIAMSGSPE